MKKKISLKSLLTIPKKLLVSSKSKLNKTMTSREMERSMNSAHGVNTIKELRPDDYKGVSVNIFKIFNMIKNRKG